MVEVCLILTPLLLITFLLLNLSMAIFLRSTFQQAVREGARYAITGQTTSVGACHDTSIKTIVAQNALGFLNAGRPGAASIHVRFRNPDNRRHRLQRRGKHRPGLGGKLSIWSAGAVPVL